MGRTGPQTSTSFPQLTLLKSSLAGRGSRQGSRRWSLKLYSQYWLRLPTIERGMSLDVGLLLVSACLCVRGLLWVRDWESGRSG